MNRACLLAICAISMLCALPGDVARAQDVLANLRKGHPRLMVLDADIARAKQAIAADPQVRKWYEAAKQEAEKTLSAKPIEHVLIGPRLLDKSRTCLGRVSLLAGLYRLDGDKRFAERAKLEMLTAAAFPDWNPKHFLDTAEMTNALAIGYDWLHDYLSDADKATLRKAIIKLGLEEGLKVYEKNSWWAKATHNWNQVCNGGMTVGALAIADVEPEIARRIIDFARKSIPRAMASFAPDGGWDEGPGYWGYTNQYTSFYLAATESALGTDFGLKAMPGYADTGYFRMHFISPTGRTFNYADAGDRAGSAYSMMYMARTLQRPLYAAHERAMAGSRGSIFHLLWCDAGRDAGRENFPPAKFPTAAFYKGVNVALLRTSWTDPNALWVGFKGGDNQANHSHLDLGTFNLDGLGQRWALDLGGDNYNLPGYFGKQRWTYYRLRTEGHNTLTLDDDNQDPRAKAPIIAFSNSPARMYAVADLSKAFGNKLTQWRRGVGILGGKQVAIVDELTSPQSVKVTWNFHTEARIDIAPDGRTATLTQKEAALKLSILSPAGAMFKKISANPPDPQKRNEGVSNLTIDLGQKVSKASIQVVITPPGEAPPKTLDPLDQWTNRP